MSAVRMCDTCSRIFSENEDNWGTAPVAVMKRGFDGTMRTHTQQRDICGDCNSEQPQDLRPRAENYKGELSRGRRIEQLERETGVGETTPE
jgi:hypothetical protein